MDVGGRMENWPGRELYGEQEENCKKRIAENG
jgi:hypothetical protein